MEISYNNNPIHYNQFFSLSQTSSMPNVKINDLGYKYYTLIMYDPDAIKGNYWHWILSNIKSNNADAINVTNAKENIVLDYNGPNPPDAKKHRYIFELYGSQEKFPNSTFDSRIVDLNEGKKMLHLKGQPIIKNQFLSQREKGGTKKRNVRRKYRKSMKRKIKTK
jgi:phosphatidylethanolamine-binding protein (PEBP) family uncharacterized protein